MMSKRVLLRADGGPHIGMGHVMRCLALAEGLAVEGFESLLVLRGYDVDLSRILTVNTTATEFLTGDMTFEEDSRKTSAFADEFGATVLVSDVCHSLNLSRPNDFRSYLTSLRGYGLTLCLMGNSELDFPADIIISPYYRSNYPSICEGQGQCYLLGPQYFVFRREFYRVAGNAPFTRQNAKRVLISIGGGDRCELTIKIASALALHERQSFSLRFIIGPAYPVDTEEKIRELLAGGTGELDIRYGSDDMAKDIVWADLAVLGDGLVKYEAALLGTPCITLARPDSDESMNRDFFRAGSSLHLGDGTKLGEVELGLEILRLSQDANLRKTMMKKGRGVVDSAGAKRISEAIRAGLAGCLPRGPL
jgi:UDP-2,4-diacetamido-2,4,6-trideoxy-beta-L-altropyranose hydrolase